MHASRVREWRDFRIGAVMPVRRTTAAELRAEGRLLAFAGVMLLCLGFPLTLYLVALALAPNGLSPVLPAAIGAPPLVLGYISCHFASQRMVKANALKKRRKR
jgi:hypothetical protein